MRRPSSAVVWHRIGDYRDAAARKFNRRRLSRVDGQFARPICVHLGCGPVHLQGWLNLDIARDSAADVRVDLRGGLPLPPASARYVFSEHVFEHFELPTGVRLMSDVHAALVSGGVLRIAMPDLSHLVERYRDRWCDQDWLSDPAYRHIDTAAHMLNFALRSWGHRYVYDFDDLHARLVSAGFQRIERVSWGESAHEDLRDLERRPDSLLVVEATK